MITIKNITDPNRSKTYFLPIIYKEYDLDYFENIENTYIQFDFEFLETHQIDNNRLFGILYKDEDTVNYQKYMLDLMLHPYCTDKFNVKGGYTLFIFECKPEYYDDYDSFLCGSYSKFSDVSKKQILDFYNNNFKDKQIAMNIAHILYKNVFRKRELEKKLGIKLDDSTELASIMDKENETLKVSV